MDILFFVHTTMKSKCSVLLRVQSMELRIKLLPAKGAVRKNYMLLNFFNNMTLNSLVELICMLAIALPAGRNSRTKYSHSETQQRNLLITELLMTSKIMHTQYNSHQWALRASSQGDNTTYEALLSVKILLQARYAHSHFSTPHSELIKKEGHGT